MCTFVPFCQYSNQQYNKSHSILSRKTIIFVTSGRVCRVSSGRMQRMHLWALDAILLAYTIYINSNRIEGRDLLRIIWTRSLTFRFPPLICFCIANRYFIIILLLLFATIRTPSIGSYKTLTNVCGWPANGDVDSGK